MESTTSFLSTTLHDHGSLTEPWVGDGDHGGDASGNGTTPECEFQALRSLLLIPFGLITLFAVPGNLLVMVAVAREKRLQNPTNVFVVGLALADIINGLLSVPSGYFFFVSYCDQLPILYFRFIVRTCCGCSVTHLVLVSVDRYIAVSKPLKYQSLLTRRRARICSIVSYVVILVYMFIVAVLYRFNDTGAVKLNQTAFVFFWNYFPSSMIVVAMVVTSIIYGYVLREAHKLRSRMKTAMRNSFQTSSRIARRSKQIRATQTLAIVVLAFAICWLPISISIFIDGNAPEYDPHISLGPTLFYYANSVMNPLIYAHRSKEFREAFKAILQDVFWCCGPYTKERRPSTLSQSQSQSQGRPSFSDSNKQMSFSSPEAIEKQVITNSNGNGYLDEINNGNNIASV